MEDHSEVWQRTLAALETQMEKRTFEAHLALCEVIRVDGSVWTITCAPNSLDWLKYRLGDVVQRELRSITEEPVRIEWTAEELPVFFAAKEAEEEESNEEAADVYFSGAYHDRRNAIIQPIKIEVHTQYFRCHWRPLLGPLLSELVRELRQRCYYGKGKDSKERNSFRATYLSLAKAIGVSEPTIKRALIRDEQGFKNEHLNRFIKSATVEKFRKEDGTIRNHGTRFVIYLDEPLVPDDQERLENTDRSK